MKKSVFRKDGFTLIEMMVVLVIITILSGIVFKMMQAAGKRNEVAATRAILEKVASAIEAYRAEFGRYPPVAAYPSSSGTYQPVNFEYAVMGGMGLTPGSVMDNAKASQIMAASRSKNVWNESGNRVYTFGLASYFYPRYFCHGERSPRVFLGGAKIEDSAVASSDIINQWWEYNKRSNKVVADQMRDMQAATRILPHLGAAVVRQKDTSLKSGFRWVMNGYGIGIQEPVQYDEYSNVQITFKDGWNRPLNYQSNPPYDSYTLWSAGPDGKTENPRRSNSTSTILDDDIVVGAE